MSYDGYDYEDDGLGLEINLLPSVLRLPCASSWSSIVFSLSASFLSSLFFVLSLPFLFSISITFLPPFFMELFFYLFVSVPKVLSLRLPSPLFLLSVHWLVGLLT